MSSGKQKLRDINDVYNDTGIDPKFIRVDYDTKCSESIIGYCVYDVESGENKECVYCGSGRCDWDLSQDNEIIKEEFEE